MTIRKNFLFDQKVAKHLEEYYSRFEWEKI